MCKITYIYVILHFRVGGPSRCLQPWMSITGSQTVITHRCSVITEHLQRGGKLFLFINKQSYSLSAQAHCSGWLCTVQPSRSVCLP
ncbi:unnamed protein product [Staurois parvus]|uniref:Secreted protein n=1 Tax=Staurois parvus TaxID=386267 RepID=A0ABN9C9I0_9NEOB|nr:unnamed protein product [Staurois parvus]